MAQIVPSAGFTPPCDYSNFADTFDLSLLPPLSPNFYQSQPPVPKIFSSFYPDSPQEPEIETPDFQKLLDKNPTSPPLSNIYLEVPSSKNYPNSPVGAIYSPQLLSPNSGAYSPEISLYGQDFYNTPIKQEAYYGELPKDTDENVLELLGNTLLDKPCIKEEKTADIYNDLMQFENQAQISECNEQKKDHQLLREVLRDTSFQRKHNIKPLDFPNFELDIKMEQKTDDEYVELARENIEPVLNMAIEQMRKDVSKTCSALSISPDPSQWSQSNVLSWLEFTSREFNIPQPTPEQWDINGVSLVCLDEENFVKRSPQGGAILYAQLEIWKAAYLEDDLGMQWFPENSISSAGDVSDDEDEEMASTPSVETKSPGSTTSTSSSPRPGGGSHIHLWQFLKELLASPQMHGSCIRWLDRSKGVFKIEDSVKVARLWGKRKNRPAMNYDKLSRSIRQYYKKGIMKKTERSQRLVYQFCHPYCL
ncbi:DNA-binding protein D-ETS-4 isoform X2 [Atheta coriaria]